MKKSSIEVMGTIPFSKPVPFWLILLLAGNSCLANKYINIHLRVGEQQRMILAPKVHKFVLVYAKPGESFISSVPGIERGHGF